jgi:hypothetical protein
MILCDKSGLIALNIKIAQIKKPLARRGFQGRMMGLEPTTTTFAAEWFRFSTAEISAARHGGAKSLNQGVYLMMACPYDFTDPCVAPAR